MTKRQAIEKLVSDFEHWLHDKGIMEQKMIAALRKHHSVTTDRIVAFVEKFALPAFQLNQLDAYIKSELQKAGFLSYKLRNIYADRPDMQAEMNRVADRLKTFTMEDHAYIVRQMKRICAILLMR